jgi:hypothetical protein
VLTRGQFEAETKAYPSHLHQATTRRGSIDPCDGLCVESCAALNQHKPAGTVEDHAAVRRVIRAETHDRSAPKFANVDAVHTVRQKSVDRCAREDGINLRIHSAM